MKHKRVEVRIPAEIDCRLRPDVRGKRLAAEGINLHEPIERYVDLKTADVVFYQIQEVKKNG